MRKFCLSLVAAACCLSLFTSCGKEDGASSALNPSDEFVNSRAGNPSVSGHVEPGY